MKTSILVNIESATTGSIATGIAMATYDTKIERFTLTYNNSQVEFNTNDLAKISLDAIERCNAKTKTKYLSPTIRLGFKTIDGIININVGSIFNDGAQSAIYQLYKEINKHFRHTHRNLIFTDAASIY